MAIIYQVTYNAESSSEVLELPFNARRVVLNVRLRTAARLLRLGRVRRAHFLLLRFLLRLLVRLVVVVV